MFNIFIIKDLRKTFLKEPQYALNNGYKRNKYLQPVRYLLQEK